MSRRGRGPRPGAAYLADVCGQLDGNCVLVAAAAPAPLLAAWGVLVSLAALAGAALAGIRRLGRGGGA
jgi:hypothetical protein